MKGWYQGMNKWTTQRQTFKLKKNMWKKWVAISLMMLLMLTAALPMAMAPVFASGSLTAMTEPSPVQANKSFRLTVNGTGYTALKLISNSSFSASGVSVFTVSPGGNSFTLENVSYSGSGSTASVEATKADGTKETVGLDIMVASSTDDSITSPTPAADTSKYKADLSVPAGSTPTYKTGEMVTLHIPVQNDGDYGAIKVVANLDSSLPVDRTVSKLTASVPSVAPGSVKYADFRVKFLPVAESRLYEVPISFKYTNTYGDSFSDNGKAFFRIKNTGIEASVSISDYALANPTLSSGVKNTLTLKLQNRGTVEASDVQVELSGFDKSGVRLYNDVDTKRIDSLDVEGTKSLSFAIAAAENAKTDNYELLAKLSYVDDSGKRYEKTTKVFVSVDGKDASGMQLEVKNLKSPNHLAGGDAFSMAFDVVNTGSVNADVVEVSIEYPGKIIPTSTPKKLIRNLAAGKSQKFTFNFRAASDIESGNQDIYVTLKYNVKGAKVEDGMTVKEYAGMFVTGGSGLGRPKIIIQDYEVGSESVMAGQTFNLKMILRNTSTSEAIKNIKIKLTSDDGVFTPVGSSTAFFIPEIPRNGTVMHEMKFKVKPDAQVKSYGIKAEMNYEDSKGNAYDAQKQPFKEEESISIAVEQPLRLETGEVTVPSENFVGQPSNVEMEFFNMGKSTMYNMFIKLQGTGFTIQDGTVFVGNFDSGRSDVFSSSITADSPGEKQGKIILTYEDSVGTKKTLEKPFKLIVADGPPPGAEGPGGPEGQVPPDAGQAKGFMGFIKSKVGIASIVALIAAVAGGVAWRIRIKKKKRLKELEEMDDEQ